MSSLIKLLSLLMLTTYQLGRCDEKYEVINFKIPLNVWRQALDSMPRVKSGIIQADYDNELEEDIQYKPHIDAMDRHIGNIGKENTQYTIETNVPLVPQDPALRQTEITEEEPSEGILGQVIKFPCGCRSQQCGCCSGTLMDSFSMNACGNISFVPEDFVFDVRMSINNNTVVQKRVSASDPPPICFNPRRIPFLNVCAEISNIRIKNRNAHACLDINADIGGFPVYSTSFKCFRLGSAGLQTGLKPKPISPGPEPVNLFGGEEQSDGGIIFGGGDNDGGPIDTVSDVIANIFDDE